MPEPAYLVIQSGPRSGERISIVSDRFTVGRRAGNSLVLTDASVSGNHCELQRQGERWKLKDLGSTNGTFYGGAKVLEVMVGAGDQFAIGSVLLRLDGGEDEIVLDGDAPGQTLDAASSVNASNPMVKKTAIRPPGNTPARGKSGVNTPTVGVPTAGAPTSGAPTAGAPNVNASSAGPSSRTGELDFVEDPPAPTPARTQAVPAAVASAVSVRSAVDMSSPDPTFVSDAGLVQRARLAAEAAARRGRLGTVLVASAAAAAISAGVYLSFFSSSGTGARHKPVANVEGNLLPLYAAGFEVEPEDAPKNVVKWQMRDTILDTSAGSERSKDLTASDLSGAAGAVDIFGFGTTTKNVRTGQRALEVKIEGRGVARASADPVAVNPGQNYAFAVHAAAGSNAGALVQLIFRSRTNPALRVVRSGAAVAPGEGKREFTRIEGTAVAPAGCDQASVSVVAFGVDDSVAFDDAELLRSSTAAPPPLVRKDLDFEIDAADGRIRKIDRDLIHHMGISVAAPGAEVQRNLLSASTAGGHWAFFATEGEEAKVGVAVEPSDIQVVCQYQLAPSAAIVNGKKKLLLTWLVDRAFAPEILVRSQQSTARHRGEFNQSACVALVAGQERERLRVSFTPAVAIRGVVVDGAIRLEIDASSSLTIAIQFSFEAEKRRAFELEQLADTADREGRIGEAIALRAQILAEFPFEAALLERNQTKRDARILEGQKIVARLERGVADADLFRIPEALRLARTQAEELTSQYQGTDVAERAKAVIDSVNSALTDAEAERGERNALRLMTISNAFAGSNAKELAAYIREYVKKNFASTKAAASLGEN